MQFRSILCNPIEFAIACIHFIFFDTVELESYESYSNFNKRYKLAFYINEKKLYHNYPPHYYLWLTHFVHASPQRIFLRHSFPYLLYIQRLNMFLCSSDICMHVAVLLNTPQGAYASLRSAAKITSTAYYYSTINDVHIRRNGHK